MSSVYKNRVVINQRGGSLDIDSTTEQEKIKISQRSGSNISLTNVVTSELATNNKQTNVVRDLFETVGGDKTEFVGKNLTKRTGGNSYELKGFISQSQLDKFIEWKNAYTPIAKLNSQFKINRGGVGYPNGDVTPIVGTRANNPVVGSSVYAVENTFTGYVGTPTVSYESDAVSAYLTVPDYGKTSAATLRTLTASIINKSAGTFGSNAPGVIHFGASVSPASENGTWTHNTSAETIGDSIYQLQTDKLTDIERDMGDGGDEIYFTKRNKFEQVGAAFNDYPSVRIDENGRSQPLEVLVSDIGTFKNHDSIPHVEEVDNSSNFPCGNDDKVVGNRYSRSVGSGGIQLKSTGSTELGGTTLKGGFKQIILNASHGIQIASEASVELQSLKSITLRTNRQVYVESSLGVKNNLIVGGAASIEGELYVQHVTAPLEVQQTENTISSGKFAAENDRTLIIGECNVDGTWYPVYAKKDNNLILNYPHSHHYNGIPMRLTASNMDVRKLAQNEQINEHALPVEAIKQLHCRKIPVTVT